MLAGIGHVQSDHGRLPVHSTSGAAGPMQISPSVWAAAATDGNDDGRIDATDPADAVATVERFLCARGAGDPAHLRAALLAFNDANWFASTVVAEAARYAAIPQLASAPVMGRYSLPVNPLILAANPALMSAPHHDFPAWDLPVPTGTQVYAVTAGTLEPSGGTCGDGLLLHGDDGFTYQYCHGSQVVASGRVLPGQLIMLSGNTGASTGPHLHFGIMRGGVNLCPQPVIRAWYEGVGVSPAGAPTTGCTYAS
ncbi:MAG: hypothetical protein NVS3B21_06020 [Acidimicrobiales bacterium]